MLNKIKPLREKMKNMLQNAIFDAFNGKNNKWLKESRNGKIVEYEFITFSGICNYIKETYDNNNIKYPGPREIKRKVLDLVKAKAVVEIFGEPPVYFLSNEFDKYRKVFSDFRRP